MPTDLPALIHTVNIIVVSYQRVLLAMLNIRRIQTDIREERRQEFENADDFPSVFRPIFKGKK